MVNVTLSETCLCGSGHWHAMVEEVVWCKRCGCLRPVRSRYWRVPLDRAGELSRTVIVEEEEEAPTRPGRRSRREFGDDEAPTLPWPWKRRGP
jgi:hypothetical protein